MKRFMSLFFVALFLGLIHPVQSSDTYNRVHASVTLSGHILFGVGFEHGFTEHHALQLTMYPLVVPGKGFPFAVQGGYVYYSAGRHWQGKLGAGLGLLVSPPDPQQRRWMPMLLLQPGFRYVNDDNAYGLELWLARFLKKNNSKWPIVPIGLELNYGKRLK